MMRKTAITFAAVLGAALLLSGCDQAPSGSAQQPAASNQGGGGFFWNQPHPPLRFVTRNRHGHREARQ